MAAVPLDDSRSSQGPIPLAANRWNRLHQSKQLAFDQAELHGVLRRVRDLGAQLLAVSFEEA